MRIEARMRLFNLVNNYNLYDITVRTAAKADPAFSRGILVQWLHVYSHVIIILNKIHCNITAADA